MMAEEFVSDNEARSDFFNKKILPMLKGLGKMVIDQIRIDFFNYMMEEAGKQRHLQEQTDITKTVEVLLKNGIDENQIQQILNKDFDIDSFSEISNYITRGKIFLRSEEYGDLLRSREVEEIWPLRKKLMDKLYQHPELVDESIEDLEKMLSSEE